MNTYLTNLLFIAAAIPGTFMYIYFCLVFWGHSAYQLRNRVALLTVLYSSISVLSNHLLPVLPHFILSISFYFVLSYFIFYRQLRLSSVIKIVFLALFLNIFSESFFGSIAIRYFTRDEIISSPLLIFMISLPTTLILLGLSLWLSQKQYYPGKKILQYIHSFKRKNIYYIVVLMFLQIFISFSVFALHLDDLTIGNLLYPLTFLASFISIVIMFVALRTLTNAREEAVKTTQAIYIEDVNQLFTTIRGQRHDFINHVQVIMSFLKRGKYEELKKYTEELVGEIQEINEIIQIGDPALAALIQAKTVSALQKKVNFQYSIQNVDHLTLGVKSVDIVKITANLIDNAFDEMMKLPPEERHVELAASTCEGYLKLSVKNTGNGIAEEVMEQMFEPGFTTKKAGEHSGIGLAVVRDTVQLYKGNVQVKSSPIIGTAFVVTIPFAASSNTQTSM